MRQRGFAQIIIIILLLVLVGGGAYYFGIQKAKILPTPTQTPSSVETGTPTTKPTTDPTANWKMYTNPVLRYSIKYPADWVLDKSKAVVATTENAELKISKGGYQIVIMWPAAFGPAACIFDDQSRAGAPEMADFCEGEFVEFSSHAGKSTHRRLVKPSLSQDNNSAQWAVYTKDKEYFVTVPPMSYKGPSNYELSTIKVMDQILSTFESTQ